MNKREFTEAVFEKLEKEGLNPKISNFDLIHAGKVIFLKSAHIVMKISIDMIYNDYMNGNTLSEICQEVIDGWEKQKELNQEIHNKHIDLWNVAKNYVRRRVFPRKCFRAVTENNIIYSEFLDLIVIYFVDFKGIVINITQDILNIWGVRKQEIHQAALENEKDFFIKGMGELWFGEDPELYRKLFNDTEPMYVLTNSKGFLASNGILNLNILEQAYRRLGNRNYFILAGCIHELIFLPDIQFAEVRTEAEKLKTIVIDVNEKAIIAEERLTDSVYYYDHETREVRIVG